MAALRVAGRRAASISTCITSCGGGGGGGPVASGLALYAASSGEPPRTAPPATYRGDPSSFPSGGSRWAALMRRGGSSLSSLHATGDSAVPDNIADSLATSADAVVHKIADPLATSGAALISKNADLCFLATGGGAVACKNPRSPGTGGGPVFHEIADPMGTSGGAFISKNAELYFLRTCGGAVACNKPCAPGTGGGAVVSMTANCFLSAGCGDVVSKIGGPRFLGTGGGAVGSLQVTCAVTRIGFGRRGPWPATANLTSNSGCAGVLPLAPLSNPSICRVRAVSTVPTPPRKDESHCFSRLWRIENKVGACQAMIEESHKLLEKMMVMMRISSTEQSQILEKIQKTMSLKRVLLWSPLFGIVVALGIFVVAAIRGWLVSRTIGYDECKMGFSEYAISLVHKILRDPEIKKDVEPYAEMGYDAVRGAVDPAYRWWQWWKKGNQDEDQIFSAAQFSDMVTSFAFVVLMLLSSAKDTCEEEELMQRLKLIGFEPKMTNVAMLHFLVKKGYLTKETTTSSQGTRTVYYHPTEFAIKECTTGLMKSKISKTVTSSGTLADLLE